MSQATYLTALNHPIPLDERETEAFIKATQAILGSETFFAAARAIFDQAVASPAQRPVMWRCCLKTAMRMKSCFSNPAERPAA